MAKLNAKKNYALIQNGVVHSLLKGSDLPEYNPEQLKIVEAGADWKPGDNYVNDKWSAQIRTESSEIFKNKENELKSQMSRSMQSPFEFKGHKFEGSQETYNHFAAAAAFYSFTNRWPDNFFWVDVQGKKVKMTVSEAKEFVNLLMDRGIAAASKYADLRLMLLNSNSSEQIASLNW